MGIILVGQGEQNSTLGDLIEECRQDYGEAGGSKLPRPSWVRWINRTMRDLAVATLCLEETATKDSAAGVGVYVFPPRWFALSVIRYDTRLLVPVDEARAIALYGYQYRDISATPSYYMLQRPRSFVLIPKPTATTADVLRLSGFAAPQQVTADDAIIALPPTFDPAIIAGACAKATIRDKDEKLRGFWADLYERETGKRMGEINTQAVGFVESWGSAALLRRDDTPELDAAKTGTVL